jgi:hypothetical protein
MQRFQEIGMASALAGRTGSAGFGEKLLGCVSRSGSAAHPYLKSVALLQGADAARNLSDAVHFLCMLHGRHPGVVDHASNRCVDSAARLWLESSALGFAAERALLTRLAVAAGPVPSTPGGAATESTVLAQCHAVEMLAQSERNGCAIGAAAATIIDWSSIRPVLEAAARRFGADAPPAAYEGPASVAAFAEAYATSAAIQRAALFGAEQIAVQHHGLWDLLEARQQARAG